MTISSPNPFLRPTCLSFLTCSSLWGPTPFQVPGELEDKAQVCLRAEETDSRA